MKTASSEGAPLLSGIECVVVFTGKSVEDILANGGTSSWRLDRNHARRCNYVVCTRNSRPSWVKGKESHGSAFLVGKVKDVVPSPSERNRHRWLIQFSEYARVDIPEIWNGDRNPVNYVTLDTLEWLNGSSLKWEPMPAASELPEPKKAEALQSEAVQPGCHPLTIAEAKNGLALTFGVVPEAVEITIRG